METKKWDIFISHASEDKATVARPLAAALRRGGVRVWLDEHELTVGDSLSQKIDEGLAHSQFGAVILSPAFLAKQWPRNELAGLRAREEEGRKVILPVWHNVDKSTISQFSPVLADRLAANTELGIDNVAERLLDVIFIAEEYNQRKIYPSVGRRLIEILKSNPDKETFVEFLQSHLSRARLVEWGGEPRIEKYKIYNSEFDAYASYFRELTLVYFTELWTNPFDADQDGTPKICEEISNVLSTIESIERRFRNDSQLQERISRLRFLIFAGRRSEIDASRARQDIWSQLRNYRHDTRVRSYDHVVDAFLPD